MIKTRAIVLHRFPYSDSSWIVKALTEECGIISFIVKGGKRKESPFKGALDPLSLSEVVFRQNPNTELQFIKEATLLDWRKNLRENLLSLAKAQVMAEMVLRYAPAGVPLEGEFQLLERATRELDECANPENESGTGSTGILKNNVFAKWLLDTCEMWGYNLDLSTCSRCETPLDTPPADFHPETGGIICKYCQGVESPRAKVQTLNGLWALHTHNNIGDEGVDMVENALLAYLRNHIGFMKEINSLKFLNETRKLFGA